MNLNRADASPRLAAGAFMAFFAAALVPRLGLIMAGATYADDWGHPFVAHLQSYRPVAALELWTMQTVFGPDYLTFKLPKVLSAFWYALSLTVLMRVAVLFGVPARLFVALGAAALLHPIMNELVLWGVLSTLAFVTFLSVLGAALVYLHQSVPWRLAGIGLLCLGAAGSQINATLGACLVIAELACRGLRPVLAEGRKEIAWRVAMVMLPTAFAVLVIVFMRYGLGYVDFGSRSIGLSSTTPTGWLQDKLYVYSNAIANLYQAPLGAVFGHQLALRAFWPVVALPVPVLLLMLVTNQVPFRPAWRYALAMPTILVLALAPLLGANAMPTGYRILGGPLLMLVLAVALPLSHLWHKPAWRRATLGAIALLAASFLWASWVDVQVRQSAWRQDVQWLNQARAERDARGMQEVQLCAWRFKPDAHAEEQKPGILISYGTAHALTYSVWYTLFLVDFLRVQGLVVSAPAMGAEGQGCPASCAPAVGGRFGPLRLVPGADGKTAFVCD